MGSRGSRTDRADGDSRLIVAVDISPIKRCIIASTLMRSARELGIRALVPVIEARGAPGINRESTGDLTEDAQIRRRSRD
jgi:hypothetical protein